MNRTSHYITRYLKAPKSQRSRQALFNLRTNLGRLVLGDLRTALGYRAITLHSPRVIENPGKLLDDKGAKSSSIEGPLEIVINQKTAQDQGQTTRKGAPMIIDEYHLLGPNPARAMSQKFYREFCEEREARNNTART